MQKGFYLDLARCTSCYSCVVACKAHHAILDETVYWRRVMTLETGRYPDVRLANLSMACMHCGTPACREVCPTHAIHKRQEDGLVTVDQNLCIGCKMCLMACPFGIPQFGKNGKMQKCNFCLERLEVGLSPACVNVCPAKALHAGPLEELSILATRKTARHLIRSTDPSFFI
jgi:anaerobic dimethyl sulfoxide reductase subunit B (iron-sulfur subunit)